MIEPKSVTLHYFAVFREASRRDRETVSTRAGTLAELYEELQVRHGFTLPVAALRVAVNDEFANWGRELNEGDRVAFIAPVAGG